MSKAIIYSTCLRLTRPTALVTIFIFVIIGPAWLSSQCAIELVGDMLKQTLLGPFLPMLLSYTLVKDEISNARSLSNGEYLSLIFTRPITRASYVLTKWLTCSIFVTLLIVLAFAVFHICETLQGRPEAALLTPYAILNALLNTLGVTAVIVLLNSFPPKIGILLFMVILYGCMLGSSLGEVSFTGDNAATIQPVFAVISQVSGFVRSCMNPSIDIHEMIASSHFSFLPLVTYLSNVSLFLFFSILVLNRREFFYASE